MCRSAAGVLVVALRSFPVVAAAAVPCLSPGGPRPSHSRGVVLRASGALRAGWARSPLPASRMLLAISHWTGRQPADVPSQFPTGMGDRPRAREGRQTKPKEARKREAASGPCVAGYRLPVPPRADMPSALHRATLSV